MTHFRYVILAAAAALTIAGSACTQNAAHETTNAAVDKSKAGADVALDATRKGADQALDATKAGKTAAKTKEVARDIATKTKEVASAAGRSRAAEIARGSEGVTRVVNQLVVK